MGRSKPLGILVLSVGSILTGLCVLVLAIIRFDEIFLAFKGSLGAPVFFSISSLAGVALIYVGYQLWMLEKRARTYGIILYVVVIIARIVGLYFFIRHGKAFHFLLHREIFTLACAAAVCYLFLPSTKRLFDSENTNKSK
jgi:hypothetical protein